MKTLILIFPTVFLGAMSNNLCVGQEHAAISVPNMEFVGRLDIFGGTQIERTENFLTITAKQISINLPRNRYVKDTKFNTAKGLLVMLIYRKHAENEGFLDYDRIVILEESAESIKVSEVMSEPDLKEIDGRSRVIERLGEIDHFPIIEFYMATDEQPFLPTRITRAWERWNVFKSRLEP